MSAPGGFGAGFGGVFGVAAGCALLVVLVFLGLGACTGAAVHGVTGG